MKKINLYVTSTFGVFLILVYVFYPLHGIVVVFLKLNFFYQMN